MNGCNYTTNSQAKFKTVSVLNHGWFVARVYLDYYYQGTKHHFQNCDLLILEKFMISVPCEATNVTLNVYIEDLISGGYTLFIKYYENVEDACFLLWGPSFDAKYIQVDCSDAEILKDILPEAVLIPLENICKLVVQDQEK